MKTNNQSIAALLALSCGVAFGCGATDETRVSPEGTVGGSTAAPGTRLPSPGRPYDLGEVYPEDREAELVDVVHWKSERIEFWDTRPDDEEPSILMSRSGSLADGELLALLQEQAEFPVTPAELWREATGRDDVPETLARDHVTASARSGRPLGYQSFDDGVRDKGRFSFNTMFPLPRANTCWLAGVLKQLVGPERGISTSAVCTRGLNPTAGTVPPRTTPVSVESTCPATLGSKFHVRAGVYVASSTAAQVARICYDSGTRFGWSCLPSVALVEGQYYVSEFLPATFEQRLGVGVDTPVINSTLVYGSGQLSTGAPSFSSNSCTHIPLP